MMTRGRIEAFTDGVLAIIITIMVLEIKVPHGNYLDSLIPLIPIIISYILSFIYIGIYWNNHHHMLQTVTQVSGGILWANLHLLFWLSLVPFVTGWIGENNFSPIPMAFYGVVLLMASLAYFILQKMIISKQGSNSILSKALGADLKGKVSPALYILAIFSTLISQWIAASIYVIVALIWLIPDRRIENALAETNK